MRPYHKSGLVRDSICIGIRVLISAPRAKFREFILSKVGSRVVRDQTSHCARNNEENQEPRRQIEAACCASADRCLSAAGALALSPLEKVQDELIDGALTAKGAAHFLRGKIESVGKNTRHVFSFGRSLEKEKREKIN